MAPTPCALRERLPLPGKAGAAAPDLAAAHPHRRQGENLTCRRTSPWRTRLRTLPGSPPLAGRWLPVVWASCRLLQRRDLPQPGIEGVRIPRGVRTESELVHQFRSHSAAETYASSSRLGVRESRQQLLTNPRPERRLCSRWGSWGRPGAGSRGRCGRCRAASGSPRWRHGRSREAVACVHLDYFVLATRTIMAYIVFP
jgi:hypothetical protein